MTYIDDIKAASLLPLPWKKLTGNNVLVTGATGLIGACVVDILMSNSMEYGYDVYASGRNEQRARKRFESYRDNPRFHYVSMDVSEKINSEIKFQFIISAASGADPRQYALNPVGVIKSNVLGVDNLLSYGMNHGLEKFLFVSSGDMYGEGDGRSFDEDYSGYVNPLHLRSCYPTAKRAAESLCIAYSSQYGIDVSIVRPCHTFGPFFTETDSRAYAQFLRNVRDGQDIILKSSGEQNRSWIYVVDCASAILYVLLSGRNGDAYNIADDESVLSIKEFAVLCAKNSDNSKIVLGAPDEVEKKGFNKVSQSIFDTSKIRSLGWKTAHPFEENLRTTIAELKR